MASIEFETSELDALLRKLDDPEEIGRKMIEAATPDVKEALVSRAPVESGSMKRSIKASPIMRRNGGLFRTIRPTGVDSKGVRNMEKAAYHNYGTNKQPGSGFIEAAASAARGQAEKTMQEVLNKEVGAE